MNPEKIAEAAGIIYEDLDKAHQEALKHMSPPGKLGVTPLLEQKRFKHFIPDSAFTFAHAAFDRILVAQVEEVEGETYGTDSAIIRPQVTRSREKNEAPRGVIITAGLTALDEMRTHGVDVGHTVLFMRNWLYRIFYDHIAGENLYLMVLRAGDISASMELATALRSGKVKYDMIRNERGDMEHRFLDDKGRQWNPAQPYVQDEM